MKKWILLLTMINIFWIAQSQSWLIDGNSGTNSKIHYVGTKDNVPLMFRVNNTYVGQFQPKTGNIFFGLGAGLNNSTGHSNIALGIDALRLNTDKSNLVAIGDSALYHNGQGATQTGYG